jgi:hypothetical protein
MFSVGTKNLHSNFSQPPFTQFPAAFLQSFLLDVNVELAFIFYKMIFFAELEEHFGSGKWLKALVRIRHQQTAQKRPRYEQRETYSS